jgi:hypothetical protein
MEVRVPLTKTIFGCSVMNFTKSPTVCTRPAKGFDSGCCNE